MGGRADPRSEAVSDLPTVRPSGEEAAIDSTEPFLANLVRWMPTGDGIFATSTN